ncbi:hypothetical protein ASD46_23635 [Rhizobium sp. Root491]|nr:hypothetical protein ASD46_23635 [Rhizobium sp. Root491]
MTGTHAWAGELIADKTSPVPITRHGPLLRTLTSAFIPPFASSVRSRLEQQSGAVVQSIATLASDGDDISMDRWC